MKDILCFMDNYGDNISILLLIVKSNYQRNSLFHYIGTKLDIKELYIILFEFYPVIYHY